jgi:extradiol dioxygenase family protein
MNISLDHIVLNVTDLGKSVAFYSEVLQFLIERLDEFNAGKVPFPSARINEHTLIDLFPPKMWQAENGHDSGRNNLNHFCIALSLDDWNALRQRLAAHSIEISKDRSINFGAHGEGVSMYFHDPDGNEIEARYYES